MKQIVNQLARSKYVFKLILPNYVKTMGKRDDK